MKTAFAKRITRQTKMPVSQSQLEANMRPTRRASVPIVAERRKPSGEFVGGKRPLGRDLIEAPTHHHRAACAAPLQSERTPRAARPLRGVSLIELLVVIGASAILLSLAAVAFTRFLQVRTRGQEHLERTVQAARLAEQFRRDVWAASKATIADDAGGELTLNADDRQVTYRIDQQRIVRQELQQGKRKAGDSFLLPGVLPLRLQSDGAKVSIALAADIRIEPEQPAHGLPWSIIATLGRDRRYATQGGEP